MPKLVVTTDRLNYGKNAYRLGDEFEASDKDAKLFAAIGKAAAVNASPATPVEDIPTDEPAEDPADPKPARTYQRRDMVAETPEKPARAGRTGKAKRSQS